jgi:hypothetical protein
MARAEWISRACGVALASVLAGFFYGYPAIASEVTDVNRMVGIEQRVGGGGTSILIPDVLHEDSRFFVHAEKDGLTDFRYGVATRSENEGLGRLSVKQRKEDGLIKRIRNYSVMCRVAESDRIDLPQVVEQTDSYVIWGVVEPADRVSMNCPIRD